jgi:hypothetical protein
MIGWAEAGWFASMGPIRSSRGIPSVSGKGLSKSLRIKAAVRYTAIQIPENFTFLRLRVSVDTPDTLEYKGQQANGQRLDRLRNIPY